MTLILRFLEIYELIRIDGALMVIRRSCFDELGGFDETYSFYGEEADFCWRARKAGWKVIFVPTVRVMHVRGTSSTADALGDYTVRLFRAKRRFVRDHFGVGRANLYERLVPAGMYERKLLYGITARVVRSAGWQKRDSQARARYKAIKECL